MLPAFGHKNPLVSVGVSPVFVGLNVVECSVFNGERVYFDVAAHDGIIVIHAALSVDYIQLSEYYKSTVWEPLLPQSLDQLGDLPKREGLLRGRRLFGGSALHVARRRKARSALSTPPHTCLTSPLSGR
ncbi:hypothetical protein Pisl_1228 [Pyrobaculum islandicum DSM 4184]|uniref:Uncharacterized protein n=1 Tax=Pyrobaculum islandicum (strain DSM 4184 / JCM 9189 / GEO3) TaxID=384616 RepID=A1RTW1_PYRIL|nr:hypothetical protein [Pyrobaculum islandicum]ABL88393.1 hypothetical protein Pisl_1228 [Pyrobaculum islandicum DSM 4184]